MTSRGLFDIAVQKKGIKMHRCYPINTLDEIIRCGVINHNKFEKIFLPMLKDELSLDVIDCTWTACRMTSPEANERLQDHLFILLSVRSFTVFELRRDNDLKEKIARLFDRALDIMGEKVTYPRELTPYEIDYYDGIYGEGEWDIDSLPTYTGEIENVTTVEFYPFDDAAYLSYLASSVADINELSSLKTLSAWAVAGSDGNDPVSKLFIIVPDPELDRLDGELRERITRETFDIVKSHDKLSVLDKVTFLPVFIKQSSVPSEDLGSAYLLIKE